ncbi:SOS response-associated peptidase [Planctomicrobium sp. SH668]|uniref:SOS response-associated peptidase n=1 Tax=Planctomicrobium sp. SH668 TaxID=3448126 RepID=UPI003F5C121C
MCGRYNLRTTSAELNEFFAIFAEETPLLPFRFNIAPTQQNPVCRVAESGQREIVSLKWGLIPSWSKDPKIGASLINARGETVDEKPSFRTAFKRTTGATLSSRHERSLFVEAALRVLAYTLRR